MTRAWRICSSKHARAAFSGEGARLYGSRWNAPGVAVVYAASTLSLAALELFVSLEPEEMPAGLMALEIVIPGAVRIERLALEKLPRNWRQYPAPEALQEIGFKWIAAGNSAVLSVPSAVIPEERNYLLNPVHRAFRRLQISVPMPLHFDPRMWE